MANKRLRVAIVHDWLIGGGAELVVLELHRMFPDAPIYTSFATDEWRKKLNGKVITGYLQHWPFSKLRKFIPFLRGWWFSGLDLVEFDLVISSSGAEAKFIKIGKGQSLVSSQQLTVPGAKKVANYQLPTTKYRDMKNPLHVAYIHAPTHYYWSRYNQYMRSPGFGFFDPLARLGLKILVGPMRRWDYRAAQRPDIIIANSFYTKAEINKYYKRNSTVIHPPVDVEYFSTPSTKYHLPNTKARKGFIITGRQTPYKRFDLAVAACTELGLPLKVTGDGPDNSHLKKIAGPTVEFLGKISREQLKTHLQTAEAFIFPGKDDFGVAAVEALAAGTPVIAFGQGGALDYVNSNTGLTFKRQTVASLSEALQKFKHQKFIHSEVRDQALHFSTDVFRNRVNEVVGLKNIKLVEE